MRVYFDNAATTPVAPEVIDAMIPHLREQYGNPSSIHNEGRKARAVVESARKTVADYLNASLGEIFFTSGGTEAVNMILTGAVRDLGVRRIITSPTEHHCVLYPAEALAAQGIELVYLRVNGVGRVDYKQLEQLLQHDTPTLVSLMFGNNEIGTLLDFAKVSRICQEGGAYFHSDTVQGIGHFPIDVDACPVHFLSGSAHKFHGPKGVGFVYINGDVALQPMLRGGAQERNMRAGTENVAGVIGMATALERAIAEMKERRAHIEQLRTRMQQGLREAIPGVEFLGDQQYYLYHVLSVSLPPSPRAELLIMNLDMAGIAASGGSACSSGAEHDSHVIQAIGVSPERGIVRFSFSHYNTLEEVEYTLARMASMFGVANQPVGSR